MTKDEKLVERLKHHRTPAPDGFAGRVMDSLPAWRKPVRHTFRSACGRWMIPALTGSVATVLILFGFGLIHRSAASDRISFCFELHAPEAHRVELLGTFNDWQAGDIVLAGPDASGHWTANVELPAGRHEYIFLVDGERWVADPNATTHRPDGFGRENTVITVYEDDHV